MNTRVIDHLEGLEGFSRLSIRTASRMVSPIRRFKNMVELSDWEDRILQREQGNRRLLLDARRRDGGTAAAGRLPRPERLAGC